MAKLTSRQPNASLNSVTKRLWRSVWLFPVVLLIVVAILTTFKISGSSIGIYHEFIYGQNVKDPNLLFGHEQPIRSDEWLVTTQLTIAQSKAGFPRVNPNISNGRDMSLVGDAPYKDWSAIFKPQNLPFFFLPLAYAIALKWWLLLYFLIVGCYFFTLRFFRQKRLFAAIFSIAVGLSPFFFWWYLTSTFGAVFYGFFIILLGMRIINREPVRFMKNKSRRYSYALYSLTLAYLLMSFTLILYPPYQIPVAIVVAFFLAGYLLNSKFRDEQSWGNIGRKILVFAAGLLISGALLGLFVATRKDAIHAVTGTVYPGARVVSSGHINSLNIFDSFLQPQLQSTTRGTHFFNNQSEASNFILLSPFLAIPALALIIYEYGKYRRLDWLFSLVELCVLMFFARVFLPFGNGFYKLFLLNRVPHERLVIGIGLASILLTLLTLKKIQELKISTKALWLTGSIYSLACFAVLVAIGFRASHMYPLFISYTPKIILLAGGFSLIIFLLLVRQAMLAVIILLLFSLGSVVKVHPLYRGLGWIGNNELFSHIQSVSPPGAHWASADVLVFENFASLANRDSISGVQPYPDMRFWRQAEGPAGDDIYNRYAHALFISSPGFSEPLYLVQPDFFEVNLSCSKFITSNVNYVLDTTLMSKPCLELKDKVVYPAATFYLYKVTP